MKDYTFGNDKDFILNYKIKDGIIIVNYSDDVKAIKYSKEIEEDLLKTMNIQRKNTYYSSLRKSDLKHNKSSFKFFSVLTIILLFAAICVAFVPVLMTLFIGMSFITAMISIGCGINTFKIKKELKEVELDRAKNNLFIKNELLLNEKIKDNVVYESSSEMIRNLTDKTSKDKKVFDLNKIDKLSLEDLKELLENIEIIEEFDLAEDKILKKSLKK